MACAHNENCGKQQLDYLNRSENHERHLGIKQNLVYKIVLVYKIETNGIFKIRSMP